MDFLQKAFKWLGDRRHAVPEKIRDESGRLNIALGRNEPFNAMIENNIDHNRFNVANTDLFAAGDFSAAAIVLPLSIAESNHLFQSHPKLNGRKFLVPEPSAVRLANDKILFNEFLQLHGFERYLPESLPVEDFPFMIKKRIDCGGRETFLIENENGLCGKKHLLGDADYFRQSFVPGDIEYTDHILFDDKIVHSCTVRFKMNREFYVRGVGLQPFENVQIDVVDSPFSSVFCDILAKLKYQGLCCFNYKVVDRRPIIFELNPRFGGSLPRRINEMLDALANQFSI